MTRQPTLIFPTS